MLFTAVWEREGKMAGTPKEEIKRIADQFAFTGELVSCGPCGSGHINETYMLRYRIGEMGSIKVILQKINREIFQKPEELMENIAGVTGHLKKKVIEKGGDLEREVLNLIPTKEGKAYLTDENGDGNGSDAGIAANASRAARNGATAPSGAGGTTAGSGTSSGRMPKLKPSGAGCRGRTTAAGLVVAGAAERAWPGAA